MKKLYIFLLILLIACCAIGYKGYQWIYGINTAYEEPYHLYIPTGVDYDQVRSIMEDDGILQNIKS
ncbi:MAG: cell division protein YceG involved in septum cleavage, partial [Saprospiraceae bacterium]